MVLSLGGRPGAAGDGEPHAGHGRRAVREHVGADDDDAVLEPELHPAAEAEYREEQQHDTDDDDAASDDSFEFAFARPLAPEGQHSSADGLADDLFVHGRIIPAYPVFHSHRHHHHDFSASASASATTSATAPPSPDTYCAWTPRSAPGSPARELPKSASTGGQATVPRFRIRDLIGSGAGRRSHSDGKEKFLFIQPSKSNTSAPPAAAPAPATASKKPQPKPKQSKKKCAAAVTEMDMATAHRLFYSKPGTTSATGTESTTTKKSYLPYRPAIVGFFAAAHGLRPKHHPY